jgi:NitT/TauT family transport system substrate-binding protein
MQVRPGFLLLISLILLGLDDWAAAEKIRVASSSPSLTARLPHMVAHEEGFFTREGLEVESIVVRNDAIILAALVSGEFTFVETGAPAAVAAIAKGLPSVIIGGFRSRLDYVLMGRKGLSTTKDLRGAKIGVTGAGGLSEAVAIAAMKKLGFERDKDYTMLYVGNSPLRMIALEQGQVDASIFSPQQQIVLASKGYPILTDVGRLLPEVPALVLSAMREKVKSNPEQAVRFLRAMHQAMNLIRNDPDRALEAARKQKYSGDFKTEREALKYYYDAYSIGFGAANVESLTELSGLKTAMKPTEFFDPSLAAKAQR